MGNKKMKRFLLTVCVIGLIASLFLFGSCKKHEHSYSSEWSISATEHWHVATCHDDVKNDLAPHDWTEDGNGKNVCSVCGYVQGEYEVAFSYYEVDEDGNNVVDANGSYVQVGVTYTSVEKDGSLPVDTINGGIFAEGEKISFTVEKSVFCSYTDGADEPLVEIISAKAGGQKTIEEVIPDGNGVYTVEIKGDTLVTVANVATDAMTIAGKGTKESPFTINSLVDWLYFASYINDSSNIVYNISYWKLTVDLDFQGESIYVIGDGFTTVNSVFCGNFDGDGHTIKNAVLDNAVASSVGSSYSNYLGLFGVVTGYEGVDSVIANLNLENITVNATAGNDDIVVAGCLLGYGVGANVRNCTVKNSTVNVVADDTYMSYAGGIVGYLQSGMTGNGMLFYASVGYSVAENVSISGTGMLYSAGGIVGRVNSYNEQVTSFIYNCYSSGEIENAVRVGGIVGELQRFSSLQNCYSTADLSSYTGYKSAVDDEFAGSVYDDRYSYAGGIVGYAENDAIIEGCFFKGSAVATATLGASYAKKGNIVAGTSEEGFADYYAVSPVLRNNADGETITNDYLQNTLLWNTADWAFGNGYPTINQADVAHSFTVKIKVDNAEKASVSIDSQYLPLSYWYILNDNYISNTIARYYVEGTNRTYGYYFDEACEYPVPAGYVPMRNMTLYAGFADASEIAGEYYLSNDGKTAILYINADGTYSYEEGVVLLNGNYEYDGEIITFINGYFSRIAGTATTAQSSAYYTFWAEIADGNLNIYDCDEIYEVLAENEEQNPTFTAMARFYAKGSPLVAVSEDNLSFTGGYYYEDGESRYVFEFNNDFTGTYKTYNGTTLNWQDGFTFIVDGQSLVITLDTNGAKFTVNLVDGTPTTATDTYGDSSFDLNEIDGFAGSWEKEATSQKIYTFDGMGNWTYEHYVYLVNDNLVNAVKQTVEKSSGTYGISGNVINFTRNGIAVTATLSNGVVYITEDDKPVQVEFTGASGFKGVWYTANNKIVRYTLTLDGLNTNGIGTATLSGFNTAPLKLRYIPVSTNSLYLYLDDVVYAVLNYSTKTGLFDGLFYDNETGSATTPQTLYLYDDFTGSWVSDISGMPSIKFNGFGAYNTTDSSGNFLAVKGLVTIGNTTTGYTVDRTATATYGVAKFTYNSVEYTLTYNEYTNEISVTYDGGTGVIAKADAFANVALIGADGKYVFDGRGNFVGGGSVALNGDEGTYYINEYGNVIMNFGQGEQTIIVSSDGYTLDGNQLYVDNVFSGNWSVFDENISIVVGKLKYNNGQDVEIQDCSFNGKAVTMYFNGTDTVSFEVDGVKYSLIDTLLNNAPVLILRKTVTVVTDTVTEYIAVKSDGVAGVWTRLDNPSGQPDKNTVTFDGCGDSYYVSGGKVNIKKGNETMHRIYKIVDGVVTIYADDGITVYATFEECEGTAPNDAYTNGEKYYQLIIK